MDHAKKSVLVQAYQFTSKPIAESLVQAKKCGVDVMVILDESQVSSKYSVINELFHQKIPIYIDYKPAISHSKIMIIDEQKIITWSFIALFTIIQTNHNMLLAYYSDKHIFSLFGLL